MLFDEVDVPELRGRGNAGLEGFLNKLAANSDSGKVDALWFIPDKIGNFGRWLPWRGFRSRPVFHARTV